MRKPPELLPLSFVILFIFLSGCSTKETNAYTYVEQQMAIGERYPGTLGHQETIELIKNSLLENGWEVNLQYSRENDQPSINVVGKRDWQEHILMGAHFDTRQYSDEETQPEKIQNSVPGANDGASGVAVLLDMSNELQMVGVRLAFFDQEDQGDIKEYEWIHGSTMYVQTNALLPESFVLLDMIGDTDLQVYFEGTSNRALMEDIWEVAADLGLEHIFIPKTDTYLIDDHWPFMGADIKACVLIDFQYPFWHTNEDTLDKISAESLETVKMVVRKWLNQ